MVPEYDHKVTDSRSRLPPGASVAARKQPSLLVSLLLPLLLVFMLPKLKLELAARDDSRDEPSLTPLAQLSGLAASLVRLPVDRWRIVSAGMGVAAKEIHSKLDLQEEETHLNQGAEQRAPYVAGRGSQRVEPSYQSAAELVSSGPQPVETQPPDYGGATGDLTEPLGSVEPAGSVEGTVGGTGGQLLQTRSDLPAVRALNVKCEKNHMTVNIVFDRPFFGLVFSKGHYNDQKCVHLPPNSGQSSVNFDIHLGKCGMSSSDAYGSGLQAAGTSQQQPNGLYIENTIIIQYDPQVQEIYDQARKLRCTWYDYYEKSVTFRPYNVDMLDAVTANFLGDNIQCWMQIQVGKGPWSSEVAGIVKIGQTMTMVLAIKDDENRFDMLVRNCVAHDGKHQPIQLVDEYGCIARPKIMAKFQKVRNFGNAATVVSYAHFQAFKFPDSMSVHFQCVIQVCRYECPDHCSGQSGSAPSGEMPVIGADYATSGTEIVSSKELLPSHGRHHLSHSSNHSMPHAVNLKLDESQGRVQVKLDTSMLAGLGQIQNGRAQSQAQSPHQLHSALASGGSEAQPASGFPATPSAGRTSQNYMSSFYYRQPSSSGFGHSVARAPTPLNGRPQVAPSSGQTLHYSTPYPGSSLATRPAYATNRIGELEPDPEAPLTLLASPRAVRTLPAVNHRYQRSVTNETTAESNASSVGRRARDMNRQESKNIRTQKTIQVVSPDDVAFSLLSEDWDPSLLKTSSGQRRGSPSASPDLVSMVCFSSGRLVLVGALTLAVLGTSIVIVMLVMLRQRAKLEASMKLSTVYEVEPPERAVNSPEVMLTYGDHEHECRRAQLGKRLVDQSSLMARRQQEEIHHRNTYLARLYSQFAPTTYWR